VVTITVAAVITWQPVVQVGDRGCCGTARVVIWDVVNFCEVNDAAGVNAAVLCGR